MRLGFSRLLSFTLGLTLRSTVVNFGSVRRSVFARARFSLIGRVGSRRRGREALAAVALSSPSRRASRLSVPRARAAPFAPGFLGPRCATPLSFFRSMPMAKKRSDTPRVPVLATVRDQAEFRDETELLYVRIVVRKRAVVQRSARCTR